MFAPRKPTPQSPRVDDSLNLTAEKLLAFKLQLQNNPSLRAVLMEDSHGGSLLWRWGYNRVLRATPVQRCVSESMAQAWDLLEACRDIPGIPGKWHSRPAWEYKGYFWTLLEWLPGKAWDPWEQPAGVRAEGAVSLLKLVHGRSSDVLGCSSGELPCVRRRRELSASVPGVLRRFLTERDAPEVMTQLAACLEARMGEFARVVSRLPRSGPLIVVHGDPRPLNFIVGPGGEFGLTDFSSRLDHSASDIGRLISGLPGTLRGDSLTVDLARTNRWGSMVQWLGWWLDSRTMERRIDNRLNELMKLDSMDQ